MKRKLNGFTLIECLTALFVLGISSLLLVQAYSQLVRITRENNTINNSIGLQMQQAVNVADADGSSGVVKYSSDKTFSITTQYPSHISAPTYTYTADVPVYVVKPYSLTDLQLSDGDSSGTDVRYIFFRGTPNT